MKEYFDKIFDHLKDNLAAIAIGLPGFGVVLPWLFKNFQGDNKDALCSLGVFKWFVFSYLFLIISCIVYFWLNDKKWARRKRRIGIAAVCFFFVLSLFGSGIIKDLDHYTGPGAITGKTAEFDSAYDQLKRMNTQTKEGESLRDSVKRALYFVSIVKLSDELIQQHDSSGKLVSTKHRFDSLAYYGLGFRDTLFDYVVTGKKLVGKKSGEKARNRDSIEAVITSKYKELVLIQNQHQMDLENLATATRDNLKTIVDAYCWTGKIVLGFAILFFGAILLWNKFKKEDLYDDNVVYDKEDIYHMELSRIWACIVLLGLALFPLFIPIDKDQINPYDIGTILKLRSWYLPSNLNPVESKEPYQPTIDNSQLNRIESNLLNLGQEVQDMNNIHNSRLAEINRQIGVSADSVIKQTVNNLIKEREKIVDNTTHLTADSKQAILNKLSKKLKIKEGK